MPVRRQGLRGGAQQGLSTLSQILASLLQNRMVGERQQELVSSQNAAISEREDKRAQAAALAQQEKDRQQLLRDLAAGTITPEQYRVLSTGQGTVEDLAPQPSFTGETGIGAQDAADMNIADRVRALQASGQQEGGVRDILNIPQESTIPQRAPDVTRRPDFQAVQQQRQRQAGIDDRLAELDPSIIEAQGRLSQAQRQSPQEAAAVTGAEETARIEAQRAQGVSEFPEISAIPGGAEFLKVVQDLQDDVLGSDSFGEFTNTLSSAVEAESLAQQARQLQSQGQTQGVAQADNRLATLLARSLESGRLTEGDIQRYVGGEGRATIDRVQGTVAKALRGQVLLEGERDVLVQIARGAALDRALPILQQEVELRLQPLQGVNPQLMERARQALDVRAFADAILGQQQQEPEDPFEAEARRRGIGR